MFPLRLLRQRLQAFGEAMRWCARGAGRVAAWLRAA